MAENGINWVKVLIAVMIFGLLMIIKTIIFNNLDNLGFDYFQVNQIKNIWEDFSLEYVYILVSAMAGVFTALKFNVKGG